MIQWLKNLFKSKPSERMVPIAPSECVFHRGGKEYIYMGDGTMEEVIRQSEKAGNVGVGALPLNSKKLKEHLDARRSTSHIDTTPIVVAAAVSSWTGDSSYSDSGSCDSSSGSCD